MQYSAPSPVIGVKKQLKDMKRFALLLVTTLTLTLQGCNDSDGDYARYWVVGCNVGNLFAVAVDVV